MMDDPNPLDGDELEPLPPDAFLEAAEAAEAAEAREETSASRVLDAAGYLEGMVAAGGAGDTLSCGFPSLDVLLGGGIRRGDLVVLGGDVGCGKSALALAMALRAALAGRSVALFSGELSAERLMERALGIQGRARLDDLRHSRLSEESYASVAGAALAMRSHPPLFAHVPPNGLPGMSDLLIEHLGLDLLVVDPLQSLARGAMAMEEELAQAVRDLKGMAVRRDCAVLLVSHLGVPVRERGDPRPRLDDFGALGSGLVSGTPSAPVCEVVDFMIFRSCLASPDRRETVRGPDAARPRWSRLFGSSAGRFPRRAAFQSRRG